MIGTTLNSRIPSAGPLWQLSIVGGGDCWDLAVAPTFVEFSLSVLECLPEEDEEEVEMSVLGCLPGEDEEEAIISVLV